MSTKRSSKKLALNKNTVRALQSQELDGVRGGMIPATRQSHCATACTDC